VLEQLRALVQGAPDRVSRDEAWRRHSDAAAVLLQHFQNIERVCWEYFDDETTAKAMFEDWCRPLVDHVAARTEPSGAPDYRQAGPRYALFTMVYLLARDSPSDEQVREACQIDANDLWRASTFRQLLDAVRSLSFASVKSDCMYLVPRDEDWGLTPSDLSSATYQYLRPLTG
jgi:hypothetical protein